MNIVVEALGDRAIKSDNPLVSSKIDFADFLALVVHSEVVLGGQGERDDDEVGADGEFQGVRPGEDRKHPGERAEVLPADVRGGDERVVGGGTAEGELARGRLCQVREVH